MATNGAGLAIAWLVTLEHQCLQSVFLCPVDWLTLSVKDVIYFLLTTQMLALCMPYLMMGNVDATAGCTNVVCYYDNQAFQRAAAGKVTPEDILPHVCTHLHFQHAILSGGKVTHMNMEDDDNGAYKGLYSRLVSLKSYKSGLKVLLTLGNWSTPAKELTDITQNDLSVRMFADNLILFLRQYDFDGVDFVWYFSDRKTSFHLNILVQVLKEAFEVEAVNVGRPLLLLSVTVGAGVDATLSITRKDHLTRFVDYVVISTIDYHGNWEPYTGINSPLFPKFEDDRNCVKWTISQWLKPGVKRQKLFLTVSPRGSVFTLMKESQTEVGSRATSGMMGPYTKLKGFLSYFEICKLMREQRRGKPTRYKQGGVYSVFNDNQWVGYDTKETILQKVVFAQNVSVGGIAMAYMDWDDVHGTFCNDGAFPLTRIARACPSM